MTNILTRLWAAFALAMTLAAPAFGQVGSPTTVIDARMAGPGTCTAATANGTTDDSVALNCKLSSFGASGGVLFIPAGNYYVANTLLVPQNVSVRGTGYGSVLQQKHTFVGNLIRLGTFSELRDIQLTQEQPPLAAGWSPYLDYDYQIRVFGYSVNISNVMLLSPTRGIIIRSENQNPDGSGPVVFVGKARLSNIRGQPLVSGIYMDGISDVMRAEDIHFWPWWSQDSRVQDWVRGHAVALESYRNDNPFFNNIFTFGYYRGLSFGTSPPHTPPFPIVGSTSRATVSGFDCDFCYFGVYINGNNTNGLQLDGPIIYSSSDGQPQIYIDADHVSIMISRLDSVASLTNVVRILGDYDSVVVGNSMIRSWNVSAHGYPAFEVVAGTTGSVISLSNILYGVGSGAPVYGGTTVVATAVTNAPGL